MVFVSVFIYTIIEIVCLVKCSLSNVCLFQDVYLNAVGFQTIKSMPTERMLLIIPNNSTAYDECSLQQNAAVEAMPGIPMPNTNRKKPKLPNSTHSLCLTFTDILVILAENSSPSR